MTNASQYSIPTLRSLSQIKSNALSFLFYIYRHEQALLTKPKLIMKWDRGKIDFLYITVHPLNVSK